MSPRSIRLFQAGVATALVIGLANVWLRIHNPTIDLSTSLRAVDIAGRLLHIAVAAGVLVYAADRAEGRALAVFATLCTFSTRPLKVYLGLPPEVADLVGSMAGWITIAALLRFCALFPAPLTRAMLASDSPSGVVRRTIRAPVRWAGALALRLAPATVEPRLARAVRPGLAVRSTFLRAPWVWGAAIGMAIISATVAESSPVYSALVGLVAMAGVLLGFNFLRTGYGVAAPAERRRVQWLMAGFGTVIWSVVLVSIVPPLIHVVSELAWGSSALLPRRVGYLTGFLLRPAISVILAFAVFYQGALDPRLAIRVVSQYGMLGIVLSVLFAFVENVAASRVAAELGFSDGTGSALAGAAVALAFGPMRKFLDGALTRLFPGAPAPGEVDTGRGHPVARIAGGQAS